MWREIKINSSSFIPLLSLVNECNAEESVVNVFKCQVESLVESKDEATHLKVVFLITLKLERRTSCNTPLLLQIAGKETRKFTAILYPSGFLLHPSTSTSSSGFIIVF